MIEVLQRFTWNGEPREIGDLFRVTKNRRKARAVIFSHQFGWEVRLLVGSQEELVSSQVCRSQEEVFSRGKQWIRQLVPNRHLKICLSSLGSDRNNPRETSPPKQSEWCCTPRYLEHGVPPSETMSTLWPTD